MFIMGVLAGFPLGKQEIDCVARFDDFPLDDEVWVGKLHRLIMFIYSVLEWEHLNLMDSRCLQQ